VQEYGLFVALMALLMVFGAPTTTLMMLISRAVSTYRTRQDDGSIRHLYHLTYRFFVIPAAIFFVIYFLLVEEIQHYLWSSGSTQIVLVGMLAILIVPQAINSAFLQGLQNFKWLSISGVLVVLLKTVGAVVLVSFGYGISGALGGAILGALVIWLITYGVLYRPLSKGREIPNQARRLSFGSVLPVFIANTALVSMTQLDVPLVKYYFTTQEAGYYAAAAVLGKAVVYMTGGIVMALFPMAAEYQSKGKRDASLLLNAVGLTVLLCGMLALFYFLCGEWLIVLLYGEDYRSAGHVLTYFGFAIFPMTLVMVGTYYLIAKKRRLFAYLVAIIALLQVTAIHFFHDSLLMILSVIGISGSFLLLIISILVWVSLVEAKSTLRKVS
jgi:O-antigen/teichoic acid export membrane protein